MSTSVYLAEPSQFRLLSGAGTATIARGASATVPSVPSGINATGSNAAATVSWSAPADGGSAITGYDVQPFIGSTGQTLTSVGAVVSTTVTGLTNGTAYTFKVRAKNAVGNSAYSVASGAVTPAVSTKPNASNTGVPAGTTLTDWTGGSFFSAATGTTIQNMRFPAPGAPYYNSLHDSTNITFVNCYFDSTPGQDGGISCGSCTNITFDHCSFNGGGVGASATNGLTIRSCHMWDQHSDGVNCNSGSGAMSNVLIDSCFIDVPHPGGGAHSDGMQFDNVAGVHVINTYIYMPYPNPYWPDGFPSSGPDLGTGYNGVIYDEIGNSNLIVENCWLDGANYVISTRGGADHIYRNNRIGRSGQFGVSSANAPYTASGNVYDDTGLAVPSLGLAGNYGFG